MRPAAEHQPGPAQASQPHNQPTGGAGVLDAVTAAIGKLSYGVVQLTVHDGKVVQLDVTERRRFTR